MSDRAMELGGRIIAVDLQISKAEIESWTRDGWVNERACLLKVEQVRRSAEVGWEVPDRMVGGGFRCMVRV